MQLEWEIDVYPDQIVILLRGGKIYGQLVREAFPDVPTTEDYADPQGEYSYAFSLLQSPGLAERVGYLLRAVAGTQLLPGQFDRGFALDWYSVPGRQPRERTALGQLLYEYKHRDYYSHREELAHHLARFIRRHPLYQTADFLVPIPTNDQLRPFDLVGRVGEMTASLAQLPVLGNLLQKTREARRQRDLTSLAEKFGNVAGLYRCLHPRLIFGRSLLVLDDLYDTGATMDEVTRVLQAAGAAACYALTLVRTSRKSQMDYVGDSWIK